MVDELQTKFETLKKRLEKMGSVAVAYSGGVDSSFLLKASCDTLGENVIALTAVSSSLAQAELEDAQSLARWIGVRHVLIQSRETEDPRYLANTPARCYFCKEAVYDELIDYTRQNGYAFLIDGTNLDDRGDHRPGRQAAAEHGVRSPLMEAGMTKADIRLLARQAGLHNWDKPAGACLSSRIPYGTIITMEMLSQVEQAERVLRDLGFRQVRVRHHESIARIEVEPADFARLIEVRQDIVPALKNLGYTYVSLDLAGFQSGSMNAVLQLAADRPIGRSNGKVDTP